MSSNSNSLFSAKSLTDAKTFKDKYIDHKRMILAFAAFMVFIGFIVYLQICGASCSGSDPCGVVGMSANASNGDDDDSGQLNGTAYGWFITISVISLCLGIGILAYYGAIIKKSQELSDKGQLTAAIIINGNDKNQADDPTIKKFMAAQEMTDLMKEGINPDDLVRNPETERKMKELYKRGLTDGENGDDNTDDVVEELD